MKLVKLSILLGAGAALSALTAIPSGAYAACPPSMSGSSTPSTQSSTAGAQSSTAGTQHNTTVAANDTNGAGLPVTSSGTIAPGSTLGGAASNRDSASNKAQSATEDRAAQAKTDNNMQTAKGSSDTSCN